MCAIPTLLTTAAGLSLLATAIAWSAQGPSGSFWAPLPLAGSLLFGTQAVCLATPLIKLVKEPHRNAGRMAGALCVIAGLDVVLVMLLPILVNNPLVGGLALVSLLATAVALPRLGQISHPNAEHSP